MQLFLFSKLEIHLKDKIRCRYLKKKHTGLWVKCQGDSFQKTFTFHSVLISPLDHIVKVKECKKRDKYRYLAREPRKLWNLKVTVIPVVIGALGGVTKGLVQRLEYLENRRRVENGQNTKKSPENLRSRCHSDSNGKPSGNAGEKKLSNE